MITVGVSLLIFTRSRHFLLVSLTSIKELGVIEVFYRSSILSAAHNIFLYPMQVFSTHSACGQVILPTEDGVGF